MSTALAVLAIATANTAQADKTVQLDGVSRGNADITYRGSRTTIRVSDNAILNYRRFDIPKGDLVRFIQPGSSSRVLNRVNSSDPSRIDGRIRANGHVYLVNPAGVIFGRDAVVDASQFYAAAATITDNDFIRGIDRFTAEQGVVVNNGTLIAANGVHLFGYQVQNAGTILAREGLVTLTAGEEVLLGENGSSIYVRVDGLNAFTGHADSVAPDVTPVEGVSNSGVVRADDVVIAAGDVYSLALTNSGSIRAEGGSITMAGDGLVTNEGTLDVSDRRTGQDGGSVVMLGQHVGVFDGIIDASGDAGGGTVLIGGDYAGMGIHRNASGTYIGEGVAIHADALTDGDGGNVIVWADEATRVYGDISARGGALGGNGGFVETSGKYYLDVTKAVDVAAPFGDGGLWLLDPSNVTIQNAAGTLDGISPLFVATTDNSTVSAGVILTALDAGTSVTISTARLLGAQDGDITINADVTLSKTAGGNATLTLLAANDININGPISSSSGQLNIVLTANDVFQVAHDLDVLAGDINIDAAITTNGGSFITTGRDFSNTADIVTGGGLISLIHTGDITLDAAITSSNGSITATASGVGSTLTINDAISAGSGIVSLDALGTIEMGAASSITTTSGAVNVGAVLAGTINLGGTLTTSGGAVTFDRALTLVNDYVIDTSAGNGNITLTQVVDGGSLLTIDAGLGQIDLQADLGSSTRLAGVDLTAAGITVDGDVLSTGDQTYTGDITLAAVTIDSSTAGAILFDGDITLTGDVIASTAGALTDDITITGDVDGGSILTLNAGAAGLIDLQADLGSSVALAEIDLAAAGISIDADVLTTGDQTYTGDLTLAAVLLDSATSGSIICDGTVTLLGDVIMSTAGGTADDITITGDVDGGSILTLDAGALGLIDLQANLGSSTVLAEIDLTATGISVDGDVLTTGDQTYTGDITLAAVTIDSATAGAILFDGDITLTGDIIASTAGALTDDITITGDVDGGSILTLNAGAAGLIDLQADLGSSTALAEVDLTAAGITIDADILTTGDQTYTGDLTLANVLLDSATSGSIIFDGTVTLLGDVIMSTAGGAADDITITGEIDGGSILTLDAGALGLIDLQADLGSSTALAEVDLTAAGITIDADILTTGDQTYTGDLTLANVLLDSTTSGSIIFDGTVTLLGDVIMSTAGGAADDITITGEIDGGSVLTLDVGALGVIDLQADIGSNTRLAGIDLTAAALTIDIDIFTTGDQDYNGDTDLGGDLDSDGGDITITGDLIIPEAQTPTITTGAGEGDFTVTGRTLGTTAGAIETLTVDTGTGDITFVGLLSGDGFNDDATGLTTLTITDAENVSTAIIDLTGNLTTTNTLTGTWSSTGLVTAAQLALDAPDISLTAGFAATGDVALSVVNLLTISGADSTAAGAIDLTGPTSLDVDLSATAAGAITINDALTLTDDVTLTSFGGAADDITLAGTVNGGQTLTLDAGAAGLVDLQDDIGGTTSLTSIDATATGISIDGDVFTTDYQTYTGDVTLANVTLDTATAGAILLDGDVTLTGDATFTTAGGAADDVTFTGTVDGGSNLTVDAGALGLIDLQADLGIGVALAELDLTAAGITIDGDVLTTGDQTYSGNITLANVLLDSATAGAILLDGDVILTGDLDITAAGGAGDDVTITGDVDGASILTIDAGALGAIDLQSDVGGSVALTEIDLAAADISIDGDVLTTGDQTYTGNTTLGNVLLDSATAGAILLDGDVTLTGNTDITTAGGAGDDVTFTGTVDGGSILTVEAGALGLIDLQADLGSSTGLAEVDLTAAGISVGGDVLTAGDQTYTGATTLANVLLDSATAGTILLDGDVTLTGDATITTAGGATDDVTFTGTVDGGSILTVDVGALGLIDLQADLGSGVALTEVDLTAAGITVDGDVLTTGDQTYTGGVILANVTLDSATAGAILLDGDVTLNGDTDIITAGGAGDDVTITGDVDGASILTVDAGALGLIDLQADLGSSTALAEVDLTAAGITVDGDVLTTGDQTYTGDTTLGNVTLDSATAGTILLDGDITLTGDTTLTTAGGAADDVTFTGTIDGGSVLTVDTGALGLIDLQADLGGSTTLAEVDLAAAGITVAGDVLTTGDQTYTGDTTFANALLDSATAGAIIIDGDATLTGDLDITTAGDGGDDVTFTGTVDGGSILTVDAGALGLIDLQADLGSGVALAEVDLTAAGITVDGDVLTTGDQTYTGDVTLANVTLDSATAGAILLDGDLTLTGNLDVTTAGGAADDVTITGTVDGASILTIDAGALGLIDLQVDLGSSTALAEVDLTAAGITVSADILTTGDQTYTGDTTLGNTLLDSATAGTILLDGDVTLAGDADITTAGGGGDDITFTGTIDGASDLTLDAGSGDVTLQGDLGGTTALDNLSITGALADVQAGVDLTDDLTITADEIDFGGGNDSVTVDDIIRLRPTAAGTSIDVGSPVGGTGTLDLSDTDMDALAAGATRIIIGRAAGTHTITVGTLAVTDPLYLQAPLGGSIDVTGVITATGDASLNLNAPQINLDADLTTAGQLMDLDGAVVLGADVTLDTTNGGAVAVGADITIGSTVDGTQDLTLNAGTAGGIQIDDAVGGATPLDYLTITNANDVTINGDVDAGSLTQTAGGGDTTITGNITTAGAIDTDGGNVQISISGDITINGDIDTTGGATGGGNPGSDGGDVDLTTTGGSVVVAAIDTSGSDADGGSNGDGGDAGDITIQPDDGLTLGGAGAGDQRPDGTVKFGGTITATAGAGAGVGSDGGGGDVTISSNGRADVPSVATVQGTTTGGDVVIDATGDITFGLNEKVSARGDIDLTSDNGTITVGDLSAIGGVSVDAGAGGTISITRRDPGSVLLPGNTLTTDTGVDWVGHTGVDVTGTLVLGGAGTDPVVGALDSDDIDADITASGLFTVVTLAAAQPLNFTPLRDGIATGNTLPGGGGSDDDDNIGGGNEGEQGDDNGDISTQIGAANLFAGFFQNLSLPNSASPRGALSVQDGLRDIDFGNVGTVYDHVLTGVVEEEEADILTAEVQDGVAP